MKLRIDSGYIMPDPSDMHRFMLVAYFAELDEVIVFRRAEMNEEKSSKEAVGFYHEDLKDGNENGNEDGNESEETNINPTT